MSKAFLRESDFEELPELPRPVATLPVGARNLMTAHGASRLQAELTRLLEQERPSVAARVSDDIEVRRELQALDHRIRQLQGSLHSAEIVEPAPAPQDVVRFGCLVTVREVDGSEIRLRIVGVDETDWSADAVSWQSPLARALLNTRRGERVVFRAPAGTRELEVVAIE